MKHLLFILFIITPFTNKAQQNLFPYKFNTGKEIVILIGGAGLSSVPFFVAKEKTSLTSTKLSQLNIQDINRFDRSAAENYSEQAAHLSDWLVYSAMSGSFVCPLVVAHKKQNTLWLQQGSQIALLWLEQNMVSQGIKETIKVSVRRIRPMAYNPDAPIEERTNEDIRKSFFSGHTSSAASNMFFMAKIFSDFYPESKWKPLVWGIAATVPAYTGYLRYQAGKHFPTDIITGYIIGGAIGYFIPELHKKQPGKNENNVSLSPFFGFASNGLSLTINF